MLLLLKRGKFADRRCHEFVQKNQKSFSFGEPSSATFLKVQEKFFRNAKQT